MVDEDEDDEEEEEEPLIVFLFHLVKKKIKHDDANYTGFGHSSSTVSLFESSSFCSRT